jgi:hypothetical protein
MLKVEEVLILGGLILIVLASWITNYGVILANNLMIPFICVFAFIFIILGLYLKNINALEKGE